KLVTGVQTCALPISSSRGSCSRCTSEKPMPKSTSSSGNGPADMAARVPEDIRDDDLEVHIVPMRRRHLRSVLRIESQVYPRPWSDRKSVGEGKRVDL